MAVNGIEIKVGQVWQRRDGASVVIAHRDSGKYVWATSSDEWYTDEGQYRTDGTEQQYDLIKLLKYAPGECVMLNSDHSPIIQLKVGQTWKTRNGVQVRINGIGDNKNFPFQTSIGSYAHNGRYTLAMTHLSDLIELVTDVPVVAPKPSLGLKIGQQWRTVTGATVLITRNVDDVSDTLYPWGSDIGYWYNDSGGCESRSDGALVKLINGVPSDAVSAACDAVAQSVRQNLPSKPLIAPAVGKLDPSQFIDQQIQQFDEPAAQPAMDVPGYETLADVLQRAYTQASRGKGVERHAAAGEPFHEQIMQIGAAKFGVGSLLFQAFKKSEESQRLSHDRAINELLGAINYLAGAVIALEIAKDTN